jgi:CO dehydrogenase maturation factor
MKISVCGKGGSGKSVITTLLARGMQDRGYRVVVIDSDESNSGLHRMLGFDKPPVPLLDLVGGKKEVKNVLPKTPVPLPEQETSVISRSRIPLSDVPSKHVISNDGISLVSVGKILQALEGCACPMGVLGREFLKKLQLADNQVAVVDMEAGVEHFGRGVESGIDTVVVVVDPSFESIQLAGKINAMASEMGIKSIWAVLNKVPSDEIAVKLRGELAKQNIAVAGTIPHDSSILEAGLEGRTLKSSETLVEIDSIIDVLLPHSVRMT